MIIAIAVVCSVVAVLGVLGSLMLYGEYQYEKAVEDYDEEVLRLESEHSDYCKIVFGHMLSEIGKPNLLQVCLDHQFYLYTLDEVCGSFEPDGIGAGANSYTCLALWSQQ